MIASSTTRIGCRPGMVALASSRQRLVQQSSRTMHGCRYTHSPRTIYNLDSIKQHVARRFLSTGGAKPGQSKPNSLSDALKSGGKKSESPVSPVSKFWKSFLGPKPMPERWSAAWYREMVLVCTVFAITGSSTMVLVRPAVSKGLGLQGSFKEGPWSFRICSLVVMTPIYATLLLVVGTVFGRHAYFRHFSVKMWSRFGIPPEMIDKNWHATKKNFRKW
mmetsp:Transcript_15827/g.32725  ORF Transcript_15827/g.32725 Transcript_15827/m.32725 type:complete len:219 (-) Transcript_15827:66-722(-)